MYKCFCFEILSMNIFIGISRYEKLPLAYPLKCNEGMKRDLEVSVWKIIKNIVGLL